MAGWGATNEEGESTCNLREVKVPIMTNLDCIQSTSYAKGMISENMMCAGYPKGQKDACQVFRNFLIERHEIICSLSFCDDHA